MEPAAKPVVKKINDNAESLDDFRKQLEQTGGKERDLFLQFPTVYIHNWEDTDQYEVYIGESGHVTERTRQHYEAASDKNRWQHQLLARNASLYIIGHEHFNRSMTMDIENRLMLYMMSAERVRKIHNMRGNPQRRYYPDRETDGIFQMIWRKLRNDNGELFPSESTIRDSAVFKASPLHRLTEEQENVKACILERVTDAVRKNRTGQLIFIEGEAGTGKTVLNSSTFYEIFVLGEEKNTEPVTCSLIVNHDEQITVYRQIMQKLGITERYGEVVYKPTTFINHHTAAEPVDVAFVDEAHLLLTQGKQSYRGKNQLQDIMERARITVIMFDENQILTAEQFWEAEILDRYRELSKRQGNYFVLKNQLRIRGTKAVVDWIDCVTKEQRIPDLPGVTGGYEIKIFETPEDMEAALRKRAGDEKHRLSRMIATYDWKYNSKKKPDSHLAKYWEVMIGAWRKPWNRELDRELDRKTKRANRTLAWAEQPQTINEIGSTFTIQGFDLNYAAVILGPSVKYRRGKIIFDPESSFNMKAKRSRTLSDGTKRRFGQLLIRHEVRVLLTRGVEGLYIYACDEELRKALLKAAGK